MQMENNDGGLNERTIAKLKEQGILIVKDMINIDISKLNNKLTSVLVKRSDRCKFTLYYQILQVRMIIICQT